MFIKHRILFQISLILFIGMCNVELQAINWSNYINVAGFGKHGDGAGIAFTNLDNNSRPEMIFMAYDDPDGANSFRYKVGWNIKTNGLATKWDNWIQVAGVGSHGDGAGVAFTNLDNNSQPEMIFMAYDNPDGANSFRYMVGWNIKTNGRATKWDHWIEVAGVGSHGDGADVAFTNLDNNSRPEMIFMAYDNPDGRNSFRYMIGWNIKTNGHATKWDNWIEVDGVGSHGDGAGIAFTNLDNNSRPEMIFMAYDDPGGQNNFRYKVGWNLKTNGRTTSWSPFIRTSGVGSSGDGAGVAVYDLNNNEQPELIFMVYDAPEGNNHFRYKIGWNLTAKDIPSSTLSSVKLERSLLVASLEESNRWDYDRDGLIDSEESNLANAFRPYLIFDSDENARQKHEPVTLFQVRPIDLSSYSKRILIKWVFLFRRDGGYGPNSDCLPNAHPGDNDDALYELNSSDDGITWILNQIVLATWKKSDALKWPQKSRIEVYDHTHSIIYMSAHKHHEYFNMKYDHEDSHYSSVCNDDVNGEGDRFLVDLLSFSRVGYGFYNNVGEPEHHPNPPFINDLSKFFPGDSAWGSKDFYSSYCGAMKDKWESHAWKKSLFKTTQISPADETVFSHYPRQTTLKWMSVPGATCYTVEVEYKFGNTWYSLLKKTGLRTTIYTFNFTGAQPGRWRVWAVGAGGQESPKTNWWEFKYTR